VWSGGEGWDRDGVGYGFAEAAAVDGEGCAWERGHCILGWFYGGTDDDFVAGVGEF